MKNDAISVSLCALALLPAALFAQTVPLTQDSYASPLSATNYGTAATINVGGPGNAQALVQFDLSTLPAGTVASNVAKATLALFVNKAGAAGTVNISVANGGWTETGLNGSNLPVPAAAVASGVAIPAASGYLYVDATAAVQNWLGGTTNSGFIVTPAGGGVNVAFDSKESATTSHPATLTITLANMGPAGATGPAGPTGPVSTVAGPAGATGPTGATGAAPATAFEINVSFDNSNKRGAELGTPVDQYVSPIPNSSSAYATNLTFPSTAEAVAPRSCTISQLYVAALMTAAGNADDTGRITLYRGHRVSGEAQIPPMIATHLACTTGTINNVAGATGSCNDTADTVPVSVGDLLSIKLNDTQTGSGSPVVQYSVRMTCQ